MNKEKNARVEKNSKKFKKRKKTLVINLKTPRSNKRFLLQNKRVRRRELSVHLWTILMI
jgi:hypothetical protein